MLYTGVRDEFLLNCITGTSLEVPNSYILKYRSCKMFDAKKTVTLSYCLHLHMQNKYSLQKKYNYIYNLIFLIIIINSADL